MTVRAQASAEEVEAEAGGRPDGVEEAHLALAAVAAVGSEHPATEAAQVVTAAASEEVSEADHPA